MDETTVVRPLIRLGLNHFVQTYMYHIILNTHVISGWCIKALWFLARIRS